MTNNNPRRGSVLVHVLITGVIVATIAAGLMRMVLMNYIVVDKATKGTQNRKEAEAMLSRTLAVWSQSGVCADIPGGFTCTGTAGTCACDCPGSTAVPRIVAYTNAGICKVDLVSSDPQ